MSLVWQAEDSLRGKKLQNDLGDLLKTMVAFANSVAPDDVATILIGERDDGTVQGVTNAESIQRSVRKEADKIYPEIYYKTEVYQREGKNCVRVDIKHNGLAPHFGGAAWVRQGFLQKLDDFLQLFLGFVAARHILEGGWHRRKRETAGSRKNTESTDEKRAGAKEITGLGNFRVRRF